MPFVFVVLFCLTLVPMTLRAQETRVEVGGHLAVSGVTASRPATGLGASVDVNLSPVLALTGRVNWFSSARGSGPWHVAAGVRGTLARRGRLALYGLTLPGIYRANWLRVTFEGVDPAPPSRVEVLRVSPRFALQMGAGLTIAASPRVSVRTEVSRLIYARPPLEEVSGSSRYVWDSPLSNGWDLSVGATYRVGAQLAPRSERPVAGRWSVGPQLGYTVTSGPVAIGTFGGFASYRLTRHIDFDSAVSTSVQNEIRPNDYEGGRLAQAVGGVKLGGRSGRFGVFFKARIGVHSYSDAIKWNAEVMPEFRRVTVAALDIGGVVEAEVSPRTVLRFDIGETLSFFPDLDVTMAAGRLQRGRATIYTVPIRAGVGWRF